MQALGRLFTGLLVGSRNPSSSEQARERVSRSVTTIRPRLVLAEVGCREHLECVCKTHRNIGNASSINPSDNSRGRQSSQSGQQTRKRRGTTTGGFHSPVTEADIAAHIDAYPKSTFDPWTVRDDSDAVHRKLQRGLEASEGGHGGSSNAVGKTKKVKQKAAAKAERRKRRKQPRVLVFATCPYLFDTKLFGDQVIHYPAQEKAATTEMTLPLLIEAVQSIEAWLDMDPLNVAVVLGPSGGWAGVLCCCYLLYTSACTSIFKALSLLDSLSAAHQIDADGGSTTIRTHEWPPSRRRLLSHFDDLLRLQSAAALVAPSSQAETGNVATNINNSNSNSNYSGRPPPLQLGNVSTPKSSSTITSSSSSSSSIVPAAATVVPMSRLVPSPNAIVLSKINVMSVPSFDDWGGACPEIEIWSGGRLVYQHQLRRYNTAEAGFAVWIEDHSGSRIPLMGDVFICCRHNPRGMLAMLRDQQQDDVAGDGAGSGAATGGAGSGGRGLQNHGGRVVAESPSRQRGVTVNPSSSSSVVGSAAMTTGSSSSLQQPVAVSAGSSSAGGAMSAGATAPSSFQRQQQELEAIINESKIEHMFSYHFHTALLDPGTEFLQLGSHDLDGIDRDYVEPRFMEEFRVDIFFERADDGEIDDIISEYKFTGEEDDDDDSDSGSDSDESRVSRKQAKRNRLRDRYQCSLLPSRRGVIPHSTLAFSTSPDDVLSSSHKNPLSTLIRRHVVVPASKPLMRLLAAGFDRTLSMHALTIVCNDHKAAIKVLIRHYQLASPNKAARTPMKSTGKSRTPHRGGTGRSTGRDVGRPSKLGPNAGGSNRKCLTYDGADGGGNADNTADRSKEGDSKPKRRESTSAAGSAASMVYKMVTGVIGGGDSFDSEARQLNNAIDAEDYANASMNAIDLPSVDEDGSGKRATPARVRVRDDGIDASNDNNGNHNSSSSNNSTNNNVTNEKDADSSSSDNEIDRVFTPQRATPLRGRTPVSPFTTPNNNNINDDEKNNSIIDEHNIGGSTMRKWLVNVTQSMSPKMAEILEKAGGSPERAEKLIEMSTSSPHSPREHHHGSHKHSTKKKRRHHHHHSESKSNLSDAESSGHSGPIPTSPSRLKGEDPSSPRGGDVITHGGMDSADVASARDAHGDTAGKLNYSVASGIGGIGGGSSVGDDDFSSGSSSGSGSESGGLSGSDSEGEDSGDDDLASMRFPDDPYFRPTSSQLLRAAKARRRAERRRKRKEQLELQRQKDEEKAAAAAATAAMGGGPPPPPPMPGMGGGPPPPPPMPGMGGGGGPPPPPPPPPMPGMGGGGGPPPPPPPPMPGMGGSGGPPPPPPPPGGLGAGGRQPAKDPLVRRKFHWVTIPNYQVKGTIWDEILGTGDDIVKAKKAKISSSSSSSSSSSKAVVPMEYDTSPLTEMFCTTRSSGAGAKGGLAGKKKKTDKNNDVITVIDAKRANNVGIVLACLKLPTKDIIRALLSMDESILDAASVESLLSISPTEEDIDAVRRYAGPYRRMGEAAKFYSQVMVIPKLTVRLRGMLFRSQFTKLVESARERIETLLRAADELRRCGVVKEILRVTLWAGNYLNANPNSSFGSKKITGFRVESLLKLKDTRSFAKRDITLLHVVAAQVEKLCHVIDAREIVESQKSGARGGESGRSAPGRKTVAAGKGDEAAKKRLLAGKGDDNNTNNNDGDDSNNNDNNSASSDSEDEEEEAYDTVSFSASHPKGGLACLLATAEKAARTPLSDVEAEVRLLSSGHREIEVALTEQSTADAEFEGINGVRDAFAEEMLAFAAEAADVIEQIEEEIAITTEECLRVGSLFGEDDAEFQPHEFFALWAQFARLFDTALVENEKRPNIRRATIA